MKWEINRNACLNGYTCTSYIVHRTSRWIYALQLGVYTMMRIYVNISTSAIKHTITRCNVVVITVWKWYESRIGDNSHWVCEFPFRSGGCNIRERFSLFIMFIMNEWRTTDVRLSVSNQCGTPTDESAAMVESPIVSYCTSEMRLLQSINSNRIRIVRQLWPDDPFHFNIFKF